MFTKEERMQRRERKKGNWRRNRRANIYAVEYKEENGRM